MAITLQAHDLLMAVLAVLGTLVLAAAVLAVLVRVLGRRLPDVEESVGTWLLRDAAAWRARRARLVELQSSTARLEIPPPAVNVEEPA